MMLGDCQSRGLAEWLQSLGWCESLQPSDLRKLNTPKMRPIWRHLQAHVVPTDLASTIRKNVLLARLEEENISVGHFQNIKLDSTKQLHEVKEILKIEQEKENIKEEIKMVDETLQNEKSSLLQKTIMVEWERHKLSEIEDKTMLLEMKHDKLLKDCTKVDLDKETSLQLKSVKTNFSNHELKNNQKSLVSKYVKNYRYPFKETDDDSEYLADMMCSILHFEPNVIRDGIVQNVKEAFISLKPILDMVDSISSKKIGAYQEKLMDLKILIIRKHQKINECVEKIDSEFNELQNEKAELVGALIKYVEANTTLEEKSGESGSDKLGKGNGENRQEATEEVCQEGSNNKNVSQVLDEVLAKLKSNTILVKKNQLVFGDEFEPVESFEQSIISLAAEEEELWSKVQRKVCELNMVTSTICRGLVDSGELNELLAQISKLASDFKTERSQLNKNDINSSEFTDAILKEIEVFLATPMIALQRKWNTSNEMLRVCSHEKFLSNPTLLQFLLQSEEKNLIVNFLEKYFWSLQINPNFLLSADPTHSSLFK